MDQTDRKILAELSQNSRITMKELGGKVHLTSPAVTARVEKLEQAGVIEGYSIKINQAMLGCPIHCFITVMLNDFPHTRYLDYIEEGKEFILHHLKTSGEGCYLVECRFPDNTQLNTFLERLLQYGNYKLSIVIG